MGVQLHDLDFLLRSMDAGLSVERALLLGQQTLYVDPAQLEARLRARAGAAAPGDAAAGPDGAATADPLGLGPGRRLLGTLLVTLGAREVAVLDASPYDGATIVHDLNTPVDGSLHDHFDLVYDGGTLEHVFNFPAALANCMAMVRPGGHLLLHAPANNQFGHGFYQFSPELFFRVLAPEYGFTVDRLLARDGADGSLYDVADPVRVGGRIELVSSAPVHLLVKARKLERVPLFRTFPQQSDYVALWQRSEAAAPAASPAGGRRLRQRIVAALEAAAPAPVRAIRRMLRRPREEEGGTTPSFRNRRFFTPA